MKYEQSMALVIKDLLNGTKVPSCKPVRGSTSREELRKHTEIQTPPRIESRLVCMMEEASEREGLRRKKESEQTTKMGKHRACYGCRGALVWLECEPCEPQ